MATGKNGMRDRSTVKRLQMYRNYKPKRLETNLSELIIYP